MNRCSFLALIVASAFGLPGMLRAQASADASDVSLNLSFADGVSAFNPGEPIRLQLTFSARRPGLSLNVTTTSPPSPVDTIVLSPLAGTFNWMEDQAQGHRYSPDYAALTTLEPGKPVTITLTMNDIYRFDTPGQYRVQVSSRRLSAGMQDLDRVLPALTSNALTFDIKHGDGRSEAAEAVALERQIRMATDRLSAQASAERLTYLPGDAATGDKLSLFLHPKSFYPFTVDVTAGLWIARDRKLVVRRLEQALRDPAQILYAGTGLFQTAVALAASQRTRPPSAVDAPNAVEAQLCHLVAETLPQRTGESRINAASTIFVTLIKEKQIASADFQSAREILITHFDDVDQYIVDWLLNSYGQYLDDPRLTFILLQMLQQPNVSRSAILHFLGLHDAAHLYPVLASELCTDRPATLPELSDFDHDHFAASASAAGNDARSAPRWLSAKVGRSKTQPAYWIGSRTGCSCPFVHECRPTRDQRRACLLQSRRPPPAW